MSTKTVRPGVCETSPVSIYGEVYGVKDLRKRCVLSLEWKREGVIDGDDRQQHIHRLTETDKLFPSFAVILLPTIERTDWPECKQILH